LQYLRKIGFDSRKVCFLRHLMFCVVRTVTEYLATDVIICSGNTMNESMAKSDNFDDMLEIHATRLEKIMRGSLQVPGFSVVLKSLVAMLNTIGEFTDIEQEVDAVYTSLVNHLARATDRQRRAAFVETAKAELEQIMSRVKAMHAKFSGQLGEFYSICFDDAKSVEMQFLENRLYWCVVNLT
jgi:hypothetical protein